MKLESVLRKKESQSVATPAAPQPKLNPAREVLAAFQQGELAEAQRAIEDSDAAAVNTRAKVIKLEQELAAHETTARNAADKQNFATARLDADFTNQKLSEARQHVSAAEAQYRAAMERHLALRPRLTELQKAVLREEAEKLDTDLQNNLAALWKTHTRLLAIGKLDQSLVDPKKPQAPLVGFNVPNALTWISHNRPDGTPIKHDYGVDSAEMETTAQAIAAELGL